MSDAPRSAGPPATAPAATTVSSPKPVAPAPKTAAPAPGVAPAPADPAADDELLELLGSLDDAGGEDVAEWLQFLARADLDKVAKSGRRTPAAAKP